MCPNWSDLVREQFNIFPLHHELSIFWSGWKTAALWAIYHPLLMAHGLYLRVKLFVCFSMDLFFPISKVKKAMSVEKKVKKKEMSDRTVLPSGNILTSLTSKWPAGGSSVNKAAVVYETTFSFKRQRMQKSHFIASPAHWYLLYKVLLACPYICQTYEEMMSFLFLPHNHCLSSSLSKSNIFFSLDILMTLQLSKDGHCISSAGTQLYSQNLIG